MDPISLGLPHRPPFVFVESVDKLETGLLAECSKTFRGSETFFEGHFRECNCPWRTLSGRDGSDGGNSSGRTPEIVFAYRDSIDEIFALSSPRGTNRFSARKLGDVGGLVQCAVEARVGQHLVAEGQIILTEVSSLNDRPPGIAIRSSAEPGSKRSASEE